MTGPRQPIDIREFTRPDLPEGAALLRTVRSEVCGTDVHLWHGRLSGVPYPIIPGHVSAGMLESIRGSLSGIDGVTLREGDRAVFFDVHRTCGRCRPCAVHRTPTRCASRRVYGITDPPLKGCSAAGLKRSTSNPACRSRVFPTAFTFNQYIGGGCGLADGRPHHRTRSAQAWRLGRSCRAPGPSACARSPWPGSPVHRQSSRSARPPSDWISPVAWVPIATFDLNTTSHEDRLDRCAVSPTVKVSMWPSRRPAPLSRLKKVRFWHETVADTSSPVITRMQDRAGQRARSYQSQAPGDSRLLGERAGPFPSRL